MKIEIKEFYQPPPPPPPKEYHLTLSENEIKDLRAALDLVGTGPTMQLNATCRERRSEINELWRQLRDNRTPIW